MNSSGVGYRVVVADHHVLFRQGLKHILQTLEDLEIVGEAGDGLKVLELVRESLPDMVILDISMPGLGGIEATRKIKAIDSHVKVLIVTTHKSVEYLNFAIRAGASGYLLKEDGDTELFSAIKTIRQGGVYISPILSVELAAILAEGSYKGETIDPEPLTLRETEVLKHIAEGETNREIAVSLCMSIHTVQHHRGNIMRKLNLRRMADLVRYAIRKGYA
ncbi:MAG: response regulator transcription factor [Thermodesulfobacteriota bacterium]|nr:response regulator transcription factor [Thermodesulfobacteriota bacterium]